MSNKGKFDQLRRTITGYLENAEKDLADIEAEIVRLEAQRKYSTGWRDALKAAVVDADILAAR